MLSEFIVLIISQFTDQQYQLSAAAMKAKSAIDQLGWLGIKNRFINNI